jgi:hypothetical protein
VSAPGAKPAAGREEKNDRGASAPQPPSSSTSARARLRHAACRGYNSRVPPVEVPCPTAPGCSWSAPNPGR